MRYARFARHRPALIAVTAALVLIGAATAGTQLISSPAAVAATTAGCGKAPALTSGAHSIQSGGQNRSYILRVPTGYDSNHPYRLVFGFHWVGGTANDVDSGGTDGYNWSYYGLRRLADNANNGTIFVAPQGNNNGWANPGGQDVTFVDDLIKQIETGLCVDTTQLFSSGFSYGGAMTYALACARANVFRGVAVYSGANLSGCSGGTQPIAYIGLHGLRDGTLPIAGGRALRDTFVRNNGCTAQNPPEPAQGSLTHIVTAYSGCRTGYPVVWAAFDGAGHDPGPRDGCTCDGWQTWTSGVVWNFFTQLQSGTPSSGPSSPSSSPSRPSSGPSSPSSGPSSPAPGTAACRVSVAVNAWNTGLTENITVTNTGTTATSGWSLAFTLPGGQVITSSWNATFSPASGALTAKNVSYNAVIAPNTSVSFGFQANHTGNTAAPTAFSLNGAVCAIA